MIRNPPFGQADLTNCERELIHLAGSIQPHGVLLVLDEDDLRVVQASANCGEVLGQDIEELLGQSVSCLGGDLELRIHSLATSFDLAEPVPLQCHVYDGGVRISFEGSIHRHVGGGLIVELEPIASNLLGPAVVSYGSKELLDLLSGAVQRFSSTSSIGGLTDATVKAMRELTGYDRVMVYKFDPDGHGQIIAEARDARLDSLLGHHYPASDIPQRARSLYIRNRVRVLVDVHYEPVPLVPRTPPWSAEDLDMSLCTLRSMSPLHLQYLKNMGVTATLVVSLVREGRLWGLIAAHHYAPRKLTYGVRAACELLGEVISTRIAAIENYAHAQVAVQVRRLEQRLIEATSTDGDWRLALFGNSRTLLQPLEATGAALFYEGEILTTGEVPSTPELRALLQWVEGQSFQPPFSCSSVARENPDLDSLTPVASGVLAMKLSTQRPDYLMWFRKEQLLSVTWAGDPTKPSMGDDPLELSPRRSFAAWSEIVRGTALPWSSAEIALARAIGWALIDIILQIHAVRLLIAEHQLGQIRGTVESSDEPVFIADALGKRLFSNDAFGRLVGEAASELRDLERIPALFTQPELVEKTLGTLKAAHQPWRGELALRRGEDDPLPVNARAEVVPGPGGSILGFMLILVDLSATKRADAARRHLEQSLRLPAKTLPFDAQQINSGGADEVICAILTNASLAAMDISDAGSAEPSVAPLLEELEASTKRATTLYGQIRDYRATS
jgi:light-regulated signal transduction histidine kinase (bacteriophytochrome)